MGMLYNGLTMDVVDRMALLLVNRQDHTKCCPGKAVSKCDLAPACRITDRFRVDLYSTRNVSPFYLRWSTGKGGRAVKSRWIGLFSFRLLRMAQELRTGKGESDLGGICVDGG